jgi:hypothetical protein
VHKSANVLNKLPKSVQPRAKQHLQDIWMDGSHQLVEIIRGVKFKDGEKLIERAA